MNYHGEKWWKNISPWKYTHQSTQLQGYVATIEKLGESLKWLAISPLYREESGHEDELEMSRSLLPSLHQRRFTCPQLIIRNEQNSLNSSSLDETQDNDQISIISARMRVLPISII